MSGWIVVAILYALGVVMEWLVVAQIEEDWRVLCVAFVWPLVVVAHIGYAAWHLTIGGWLWRRQHRAWCAKQAEAER